MVNVMAAASRRQITSRIAPSFFIPHPKPRIHGMPQAFLPIKLEMDNAGYLALLLALILLTRSGCCFLRSFNLLDLGRSRRFRHLRFGWSRSHGSGLAFPLLLT